MVLRFIRWRRLGHLLIVYGHAGLIRRRDASGNDAPTDSKPCPRGDARCPAHSDDAVVLATKLQSPECSKGDVPPELRWRAASPISPTLLSASLESDLPASVL